MLERPVFLAWPLPAHIGLARISQYPNSGWIWHYLGLNPGYECPPMFGYLLNVDSWPYWRDVNIPEAQDKAQADPHNFEMVACYSTDGSAGSPDGHEGTDIKAPAGTPVYASAAGLVQEWRNTGLNSMIVLKHCLYGIWDANFQCVSGQQWYTTYMHIALEPALLKENTSVEQGAVVGTIYDQTINSHLHFEVGHDRRSYANFVNPWGRDTAPWLGCLWLDQALCVNPDPAFERIASYSDGELLIEQGDGSRLSVKNAQGLKQIRLWGERVAVLDAQGRLFVREGTFIGASSIEYLSTWPKLAENVLDFQITDTRIAILDPNRQLLVQENPSAGEWLPIADNVRAFSLADARLGYLTEQGDLYIQAGPLKSNWQLVKNRVLAFQLVDNRIAYLDEQRQFFVNEGDLAAEFQLMAQDVQAFQLTNVRIGMLDGTGKFSVKEGNLRAAWAPQADRVQAFQLVGSRVLSKSAAGKFSFKTGDLYQSWSDLTYIPSASVFLNGEMPTYIP
jgi:murein DD-endopeptidase MepM/ murein hydrolase activator NlpD